MKEQKLRITLKPCGGFAWSMNGRPKEQPHMPWCPQYEEYQEWFSAINSKDEML